MTQAEIITSDPPWSQLIATTRDVAFYVADMAETVHGPAEAAKMLLAVATVHGINGTRLAGELLEQSDRLVAKVSERTFTDAEIDAEVSRG